MNISTKPLVQFGSPVQIVSPNNTAKGLSPMNSSAHNIAWPSPFCSSWIINSKFAISHIIKDCGKGNENPEDYKITALTDNEKKELYDKLITKVNTTFFAENIIFTSDDIVKAYERIRANVKNGLAVVPIERGASGGSYFTIPPQVQMEIASRKKIITDEHSGRILVDSALADEEQEKMNKLFAKLSSLYLSELESIIKSRKENRIKIIFRFKIHYKYNSNYR